MVFQIGYIKTYLIILAKHQIRYFSKKSSKLNTLTDLNKLLLQMPRDRKHIAEAQQQRLKIKEKGLKYAPGTVNLQVLGCGAPGSPASVYLFTDHTR